MCGGGGSHLSLLQTLSVKQNLCREKNKSVGKLIAGRAGKFIIEIVGKSKFVVKHPPELVSVCPCKKDKTDFERKIIYAGLSCLSPGYWLL